MVEEKIREEVKKLDPDSSKELIEKKREIYDILKDQYKMEKYINLNSAESQAECINDILEKYHSEIETVVSILQEHGFDCIKYEIPYYIVSSYYYD